MKNYAIHGEVDILSSLTFSKDNSTVPLNPKPRQISIINGQPCIWTDIGQGFYSWFPMGVKQSAYVHSQGAAALTWTINHGMDTNDYGVFVYDVDHSMQLVNSEVVDSNTIRIELSEAMMGTAVVFGIPGQAAVAGGIQSMGSVADVIGLLDALATKANLAGGNTFTGVQTFDAAVMSKKVDLAGTNIDLALSNLFVKTISGATTLTVSNAQTAGVVSSFMLELINAGTNMTYWTGVKWAGGNKPTLTVTGKDVLAFLTHDGGVNWTGLVVSKDVK